jgi:hypothetical protein
MQQRKSFYLIILTAFNSIPLLAFAGDGEVSEFPFSYFSVLFDKVATFIQNFGLPYLFGALLLFFLWGLAMLIFQADNEEKRERGKKIMLWGIILLFVATSFWTIIEVLQIVFGTGTEGVTGNPTRPELPGLQ